MTVRTSRGLVQLARCRLILVTEKCKIKFKVHKSAALALVIPGAVTKAVLALNTALSCLPLQTKSSIVKALDANFKVLTARSSIDDVTTQDDVSNDEMFEDDVIDPEKAPSEAAFTAPCRLFSTILKWMLRKYKGITYRNSSSGSFSHLSWLSFVQMADLAPNGGLLYKIRSDPVVLGRLLSLMKAGGSLKRRFRAEDDAD